MKNIENKNTLLLTLIITLIIPLSSCSQHGQSGAALGGTLGALTGAIIDDDNRWRGAAIGGAIGAVFGGTLSEISYEASREAAREGKTVVYESEDGYKRVEADPVGYNQRTKCHKVRERVWDSGRLIKDEVKEICESEKTEPGY